MCSSDLKYHISQFIHKFYLVLFLIFHIFHVFHMLSECFNNSVFHNIYHVSHRFSKYFQKMFCQTLHTDFTEMAESWKIPVCCSYASWPHSHCYNAHCRQSTSILTDSLLIASEYISIYSNSEVAIAKPSFSIRLRWFSIIVVINNEYWLMLSIGTSNVIVIILG